MLGIFEPLSVSANGGRCYITHLEYVFKTGDYVKVARLASLVL